MPRSDKIIETFDRTALSAPAAKAGRIRKWNEPIRYRIDGLQYDKTRIAISVAALEKTAQLAGLQVREAQDGERENFVLMFRNVAYFDVSGFKASCVAYWRASTRREHVLYHVRLDINLAADPDISRCIFHEVLHGLGLLGHPERVDSVLSYGSRNIVEPAELDILLLRLLYDEAMRPGMGRLPALLTAHRLLAAMLPGGADLPTAYLDEVVKQLQAAAEQGSIAAQRQLVDAYRNGHHVKPDVGIAEYWRAVSNPATLAEEGIPLDDPRFMPFSLGSSAHEGYRKYLSRTDRPRVFSIASSGSWGWSSGYRNAEERALATCQQYTQAKCVIYSVDDRAVWRPGEQGPYGDEDMDWGIIAEEKIRQQNKTHSPTPRQHPVAAVLQTDGLKEMMKAAEKKPVLLDLVYGEHWSLPGAYQLEALGVIDLTELQKLRLRDAVEELRDRDADRPIVVFCSSSYCWLSYNAALHLNDLGVRNLHWYRGGIAAWRAAGQPVDWPASLEPF